ncbi:clostripain-related cysteine peptidase [Acetivibrio straminisolvens]|uniref:clostripain-related cysteine peptidase n=1 Tax=Acetivibrio straminisolvens TaxID=253314 RepID=UPI00223F9879|nr:clostripain-related cysteine peptidase [Acetivibrio straminisolvens]
MNRDNRPTGRQKRIGTGTGNVSRRGSGLNTGPVGKPGGYSDRSKGAGANRGGGSGRSYGSRGSYGGYGGYSSGRRGRSSGCSKYLTILIFILAIGFYIYNNFGGNLENSTSTNNFQTGTSSGSNYVDKGEYPVVTTVSELAREKRTVLKGNGEDTATVMIYMCGTDLETKWGMATADLQEMLNAEISDKVNIIVETGGTSKWQNNTVSSKTNQRFKVTNDGLKLIENNLGKKSMVNPDTLADFIKYCKTNYPADRYMLILWDHGGGSAGGFGYDQHYPNDAMKLDEIAAALKRGDCTFDLIGFDACLMATLETAVVLEPYADYMIASEEVEPGIGWYYTGWITALSQNTSIKTIDLGKKLIDDYVKEVRARTPKSQATLSLVDLAELKGTIPPALTKFAKSIDRLVTKNEYKTVSNARANTKEFARSSKINQIDLVHFAENLGTNEGKKLAEALRGCIKYNRTSKNITNANGLAIFFPYGNLSKVNSMLDTYEEIGIDKEYSKCIRSFASVSAGGQIVSSGSNNMLDVLLGNFLEGSSGSGQSITSAALEILLEEFLSSGNYGRITGGDSNASEWLDIDLMKSSIDYYKNNRFDPAALKITEKGGQRVLAMSEEQWGLVQQMELNVFIDDGEGFIDLGLDNVYEFNEDGDLIMEYDGTWLALNGNIVSYYMVSDDRDGDTYSTKGRIPALLNGQLVDIIVVFDNENPYGKVLGAQIRYDTKTDTETLAKGLIDIVAGDKIDFLCDYYTYEGEYINTYFLGEQYTATGEWEIENLHLGDRDYMMTYRITDIYGNKYWTPSVAN